MRLRLYENHRFVLYAPFYAAYAVGAYAAERAGRRTLAVTGCRTGRAGPARRRGRRALGRADAGHEAPRREPNSALVCFAEVVRRDPFSIVGQYPNPDFRLCDLAKMRLATGCEVPTPWLCLQADLWQAGIDPARLDRITDRSMAENLNALSEGRLEAAQFSSPLSKKPWPREGSPVVRGEHTWPCHLHGFVTPGTGLFATPNRYCPWSGRSSGHSSGSIAGPRQRSPRRSHRSFQRSIAVCWPPHSLATRHSRCGDAIRFFPRTALIVCGDTSFRAGSSVGRRIRSLRRQSPRPASPDRIGFAYEPEARADSQSGSKGDSDLSPQRRFGIYLPRGLYYAVSQAGRVGRHCSSDAFGHFLRSTFRSLAEYSSKLRIVCASELEHAAPCRIARVRGTAIKRQQFLKRHLFSVRRSSIYCRITVQCDNTSYGGRGREQMATLDEIGQEKQKVSERLARLDAEREKLGAQLNELEVAERVLTRFGRVETTMRRGRGRPARAAPTPAPAATRGRARAAQPAQTVSLSDATIRAVQAHGEGATPGEVLSYLAREFGMTVRPNHLGIALQRHRRAGRLETRDSRWFLPQQSAMTG